MIAVIFRSSIYSAGSVSRHSCCSYTVHHTSQLPGRTCLTFDRPTSAYKRRPVHCNLATFMSVGRIFVTISNNLPIGLGLYHASRYKSCFVQALT